MKKQLKNCIYALVLLGCATAQCGSYDDFFSAIEMDNPSVVEQLMQRGFDPNTVNPQGEYGLIVALRKSSTKVVNVLLAQSKIDINVRTAKDENPLMLAALKGYADVCQKLIDNDADINKPGWTALHYAATGGHVEIMRMLLDNHAYIDAASPNGSTPLMMAALYGTASAVKLLLESGADVSLKNELGLTALDFASKTQRADSIEIIAAFMRARQPKAW